MLFYDYFHYNKALFRLQMFRRHFRMSRPVQPDNGWPNSKMRHVKHMLAHVDNNVVNNNNDENPEKNNS
jgi:hypothetical protein